MKYVLPVVVLAALSPLCSPTTEAAFGSSAQTADGTISVAAEGSPAAGVDIFLFVNQGKQPLGTTNNVGQLPFDPALLTGKVRVTVVVRECPQRTELYLVSVETDNACREVEEGSDEPDCSCREAGAIWWGSSIRVDVTSLTSSGASTSLVQNPLFWIGTGGAAGAAVIITATGGDDAPSTSVPTTTPPSTSTTPPPSSTPTPTPPPTGPASTLEGNYSCSLVVISNVSNHPDLLGALISIFVRQQSDASSVFGNNENFIEVHGPFLNNHQDLRGMGNYAGFSTTAEWTGNFMPGTGGSAEIQGEYAAGTNGSLPGGGEIRWRFNCSK